MKKEKRRQVETMPNHVMGEVELVMEDLKIYAMGLTYV